MSVSLREQVYLRLERRRTEPRVELAGTGEVPAHGGAHDLDPRARRCDSHDLALSSLFGHRQALFASSRSPRSMKRVAPTER